MFCKVPFTSLIGGMEDGMGFGYGCLIFVQLGWVAPTGGGWVGPVGRQWEIPR